MRRSRVKRLYRAQAIRWAIQLFWSIEDMSEFTIIEWEK